MIRLPLGFAKSFTGDRVPFSAVSSDRRRKLRSRPCVQRLEDRSLLTTYTTPAAIAPVVEMVYGPVGDIWFSRVQDLSITRIDSSGNITEYGAVARAQPLNLEVDANDNLWFTSAAMPPSNYLFRLTVAGALTQISNFNITIEQTSQDPNPPVYFLTHGHINGDNTGLLAGIRADGSVGFYPLLTGVTTGPGQYWARPFSVAVQPAEWSGPYYYQENFWYTDDNGIGMYGALPTYVRYPLPDANDQAAALTFGGDGNIWFVENSVYVSPSTLDTYYVADKIGKITPDGTITTYDVKRAGFRLKIGALVPASDGSIWFNQVGVEEDGSTPEANTHRIGHINTTSDTISYYIPPDSAAGATAVLAYGVSPSGAVVDSPWFNIVPFQRDRCIGRVLHSVIP